MLDMMIIDDEAVIRESLKRFIDWESVGVRVTSVEANGSAALDTIREEVPDIILSDINMPMLNGLELLEFLNIHKIETKVIFISAHSRFDYAQQAIRLGAFDYILKPIDEERLLEAVGKCAQMLQKARHDNSTRHDLNKYRQRQFAQVLQRMYCEEGYELSPEDCAVLGGGSPFSGKSRTVISLGFWGRIPDDDLFSALSFPAEIFRLSPEMSWQAIVILSEDPEEGRLYNEVKNKMNNIELSCLSRAYSFRQSFERLYTETVMAHYLLPASPSPACFPEIERTYLYRPKFTQDEILEKLLKRENEQAVPEMLNYIFFAFVLDESIYDLNTVKLGLIRLIDSLISHLNNFRYFESLNSSTLSAKKNINAQRSIDRVYDISKNMLINLTGHINELHERGTTQLVRAALHYIRENYAREISLTEIANLLYVSPTYLSKIFSAEINQPFSKYILEYRIKKSVELLADPQLKIYDIASRCGFSDIAHFSRTFKQVMGTSPHKYRNRES